LEVLEDLVREEGGICSHDAGSACPLPCFHAFDATTMGYKKLSKFSKHDDEEEGNGGGGEGGIHVHIHIHIRSHTCGAIRS